MLGNIRSEELVVTDRGEDRMDEDDFEKKVRAFGGKYIAPGIEQAAENSESLQIAIFALLETISWIVQQENRTIQ